MTVNCCCSGPAEDERNLLRILDEEREYSYSNLYRLKCALQYKRDHLTDKNGKLYLTLDSLITINNLITKSANIKLRTVNVRPSRYEKAYMDFYSIEPALRGLIDNFSKTNEKTFVETFLKIHRFLDGNGRTGKVLFI